MASNGGRLHEIEARARGALEREPSDAAYYERQYGAQDGRRFECEVSEAFLESLERVRDLEAALRAASDDARILVQDYYSGLPEHRAPVDGAVARLAHLFERDDQDCEARTVDEIITEGMSERAVLAGETAGEPK